MQEVDNIIRILKETKIAIGQNNSYQLKQLSNQTIHAATVSQDADNIIVAVLVYSFSKIIERENYREMPGWNEFYKILIKNLELAIKSLEQNKIDESRTHLGAIRNSLNKIEGNLAEYIKDIFRKAEINKAFKIYEHGLSSEQTAKLLGVSLWDLSSYIGQSSVSEAKTSESLSEKQRIKFAEEIFA